MHSFSLNIFDKLRDICVVASQEVNHFLAESTNFLNQRLVTLLDPIHITDEVLGMLVYPLAGAFAYKGLQKVRILMGAPGKKFKKLRIQITCCMSENLTVAHRNVLIRKGIPHYIALRIAEQRAISESNYIDFVSSLELTGLGELDKKKVKILHWISNLAQDFFLILDLPIRRCLLNYIRFWLF
jgi:hypothetical protein